MSSPKTLSRDRLTRSPESQPTSDSTISLRLWQVDAFTSQVFGGNPAAVVVLPHWLPDTTLAAIAAENNVSETAFLVTDRPIRRTAKPAEGDAAYALRWFTPKMEVDLCGHATLGSAWVLFQHLHRKAMRLEFATKSGPLVVTRRAMGPLSPLSMDFPARPAKPVDSDVAGQVVFALGGRPAAVLKATMMLAVFETADEVRALKPDFAKVAALPSDGLIATAPAGPDDAQADFVSRYFAPSAGIDEDPVTGSAHCTLAPYWNERLRKADLLGRQVSQRGGEVRCHVRGDRVILSGRVSPYLEGRISVPAAA